MPLPPGRTPASVRRILDDSPGVRPLFTMTTRPPLVFLKALSAVLIGLAGCRLPDTWGVGVIDGSLHGTSTATLEAFGGPRNFEADTDLDHRAIMLFVAWSAGYPVARRNAERLERIEATLAAMRARPEEAQPCR